MVTKEIMGMPVGFEKDKCKQEFVTGEILISMINNKVFYDVKPEVPCDKISPEKDYVIYTSYGISAFVADNRERPHIHYVEEIVPALANDEKEKWENVRNNAAISMMNALLETTQHSVVLEPAANTVYAKVAVAYADSLIKELRNKKDWVEKILEV